MKSGFRSSAPRTSEPSSRAGRLAGGSCRFRFTCADCTPAVARPSSHSAAASTCRQRWIWSASRTAGTWTSMNELPRGSEANGRGEGCRAAGGRRGVTGVVLLVVEGVADVVDVELQLERLPRVAGERVEPPVRGHLVEGQVRGGRPGEGGVVHARRVRVDGAAAEGEAAEGLEGGPGREAPLRRVGQRLADEDRVRVVGDVRVEEGEVRQRPPAADDGSD